MNWLKARLSEGSTIAGLCGLIPQLIGVIVSGPTPAAVAGLIVGAIAVLVPESVAK